MRGLKILEKSFWFCYVEFEHARDFSNFPDTQPKWLLIKTSRPGQFIPGQAFYIYQGRKIFISHQHVVD